ncbi:DNA-directed RNA polymerase subunit beta' [Candidatus Chloroploca asiatica]|uniref:DNA-directed RNA polymerase subunit beta' n=1 Tax=Candidatus Chloroploca asiatica TaxID=1506545 RepID=A0A2H3KPM1_9CHLR|nr:DNA-directed RNA polymerase subunit beta' [Candidatus Chloroploca asiatica]PDV97096.1 DNA-directed RNA polymerase subunit beta' [Candidatus Chloroploca asiatica]
MLEINDFNAIRISLASPEDIRGWSHGEVTKPETINYRTLKPERDGLFCERIFGPTKDWECYCGKYKRVRYKGVVCDKCGVEVTRAKVRRDRMGHISLASPVSHIWFVKGTPSRLGLLLDISPRNLERVLYFASYVIVEVKEDLRQATREVIQQEYAEKREKVQRQAEEKRIEFSTLLTQDLGGMDTAQVSTQHRIEEDYKRLREEITNEADRLRERLEELTGEPTDEDVLFRGTTILEEGELISERIIDQLEEMVEQELEALEARRQRDLEDAELLTGAERERKEHEVSQEQEKLQERLLRELEGLVREEKEKLDLLEGLKVCRILTENEYRQLREVAPGVFRADMGAGAVRELIEATVDLAKQAEELQFEVQTTQGQRRKKATKRLRVVEAFRKSGNKPEWMILTMLPVIPPDLRPMVQLDGGRFATSDLNDLYRRVINRNNRLKRLMELNAPEIIVRNEKRMLQEAVDALIDNGRRGRAVSGKGKHRLKSLSDMLKGKQGRFRQNLLGKRVDYSGRSVIVVGPNLQLHQCGLPKKMALELFKPFVMRRLVEKGFAHNIKSAKRIVERVRPEVWDVLEEVIKDYLVLLNRAPSLHRLSIQAFEAKLIEGSAIQLHPLVCAAFNADFDGDQMAVHVPLSRKAQEEARSRMLSKYNLLSPAHGDPIITPSQDIVLGCYYLSMVKDGAKGSGKKFSSVDEAMLAYDQGLLDIQAPILIRMEGAPAGKNDRDEQTRILPSTADGTPRMLIETTIGRVLLNNQLLEPLRYRNRLVDKKGLKEIIADCYKYYTTLKNLSEADFDEIRAVHGQRSDHELARIYGSEKTALQADMIKALGFKYATLGGMTIGINDIEVPRAKYDIISNAEAIVADVEKQFRRGLITEEERYEEVVRVWQDATKQTINAVKLNLNQFGPVAMMSTSGARGNINQISQMAGMRGLMADPTGRIIELPIKANFREGLSVLDYFVSTHGGRKGLADTALRTADAGYLTRRLVDVAQDVIVTIEDCGTENGVWLHAADDDELMEKLQFRVIGRILAAPVYDPETGEMLADRNAEIDEELSAYFSERNVTSLYVRSTLSCQAEHGICRLCYGRNLATGKLVDIGEACGIIAAQSIGEPGTQLTLRTFHTGGVASADDITQGLPRIQEIFEARIPKGKALLAEIDGVVQIAKDDDGVRQIRVVASEIYTDEYLLPKGYRALIENESDVAENQPIAEPLRADSTELPIVARLAGRAFVYEDRIVVSQEDREERELKVPHTSRMRVESGERVVAGQHLTDGSANPQELLDLQGKEAVQRYLVNEAQKVYRSQGVNINDKHVEVIVRQMLRRVRIEEPGDTGLLPGELIDAAEFRRLNNDIVSQGGEPATAATVLLGITKASLNTDSFLSAASFQETTRVLTDAAINGKVDYLRGLKENVVIGKLIPAGSGIEKRLLDGTRREDLVGEMARMMEEGVNAEASAPTPDEVRRAETLLGIVDPEDTVDQQDADEKLRAKLLAIIGEEGMATMDLDLEAEFEDVTLDLVDEDDEEMPPVDEV